MVHKTHFPRDSNGIGSMGSPQFVSDVALLAVMTCGVHYVLGMSGLVCAVAVLCGIEYCGPIAMAIHGFLLQLWTVVAVGRRRTYPLTNDHAKKALDREMTMRFPPADHAIEDEDEGDEDANNANNSNIANTSANSHVDHTTTNSLPQLSIRDHLLLHSPPTSASSTATTATIDSTGSQPPHSTIGLNTSEPVAFENDLFAGHVLFLVRTCPPHHHWARLFAGKRRMFWIQVQGRFKRPPRGIVYLGGELPGNVSLGIFSKSIALMIIGIIQRLIGKVYVSFGGTAPATTEPVELPCVSFPLYQSVDQFMETPEGDTPPPLGSDDFGETDHARTLRRRSSLGAAPFRVGPTYSFHFHTMYVDLTRWKTANLPGLSDMDLTTFFDAHPLRLVAYEVDATPNDTHLQHDKNYLFNFEVTYTDPATLPANHHSRRLLRSLSDQSIGSSGSSASTGLSSHSQMTAATSDDPLSTQDRENACRLASLAISFAYWIEEVDLRASVRRVHYVYKIREDDTDGDEHLVVVSAYTLRLLGGRYHRIPRLQQLQSLRFHARSHIGSYSIIDEEAHQVTTCLQSLIQLAARDANGQRASSRVGSEASNRSLTEFESALYQALTTRTHLQLLPDGSSLTSDLTPASLGVSISKRDRDDWHVVFEGIVYRFYADSVVRQEVMVITPDQLMFYRSYSSNPDKVVASDRVIGVQAITLPYANADSTFAYALQINTFAEEICVCVPTEHARNTWIRVILQHCSPHDNFDRSMEQPMAVCSTPSVALKPANRVVLNSRALFPRGGGCAGHQDALVMVQTALRSALAVHNNGDATTDVTSILEFLNHASALRNVDWMVLMDRPHEDKLAFFLNLYHLVLAHAMIAQGFPSKKSQWERFQTRMCYAVGKDQDNQSLTMSLAEIEHVILRARLPRAEALPHLSLSSLSPAHARRLVAFGLAHPDFRVSFALVMNHSSSHHVPVFEAAAVHDQLNQVLQQYMADHLFVDLTRQTITLPRICEWYKHDFGGSGSAMYCVRKLLGFMDPATQELALQVLDSPTLVHIKYGTFQYAPRGPLAAMGLLSATPPH